MSANEVRITCGLGAWHDGHRDRVLAIAVREPDPLKADAPGWRFLTGPELHGDLAEMERRVGPVVVRDEELEKGIIYLLCKCGWPSLRILARSIAPVLDKAADDSFASTVGFIDIANLYPLGIENRNSLVPSTYEVWSPPNSTSIQLDRIEGRVPNFNSYIQADLIVMCDGKDGTPSRSWHKGHRTRNVLSVMYAHTRDEMDYRRLRPDRTYIYDPSFGRRVYERETRFRNKLIEPDGKLKRPVFGSSGTIRIHGTNGGISTIQACPCGRDDLPVWRGAFENHRPFTAALDAGIHVLSVEGFRRLLEATGDLIK